MDKFKLCYVNSVKIIVFMLLDQLVLPSGLKCRCQRKTTDFANMISCKFDASLMQVLMQVGIKNRVVDIFSACCNKEFRCKFVASLS